MLRTLPMTRDYSLAQRFAIIFFFVALTAISAQIKIYFGSPVPFTMQVMVVLLAGMVLGARDGVITMALYLGLIALNLPLAADASGASALTGATAGYLIGFVPAAGIAGLLVEKGANRVWQRWLAGIVGIAVIYACGVPVLMRITGMDFSAAWAAGVVPFIALDLGKALLAAALSEGGRSILMRYLPSAK